MYVANGSGSGSWSWQPQAITLDIATINTSTDYYLVMPHTCTIDKIYSVIDAAVATADKTITSYIGATPLTNGSFTIATAGSAAGDVDSCTPTAANTLTAGQALKLTTAGGSTGDSRVHITVVYTRTS